MYVSELVAWSLLIRSLTRSLAHSIVLDILRVILEAGCFHGLQHVHVYSVRFGASHIECSELRKVSDFVIVSRYQWGQVPSGMRLKCWISGPTSSWLFFVSFGDNFVKEHRSWLNLCSQSPVHCRHHPRPLPPQAKVSQWAGVWPSGPFVWPMSTREERLELRLQGDVAYGRSDRVVLGPVPNANNNISITNLASTGHNGRAARASLESPTNFSLGRGEVSNGGLHRQLIDERRERLRAHQERIAHQRDASLRIEDENLVPDSKKAPQVSLRCYQLIFPPSVLLCGGQCFFSLKRPRPTSKTKLW